MSINCIVQALLYIGENPTIQLIKDYLGELDSITEKTLDIFCHECDEKEKELLGGSLGENSYEEHILRKRKADKYGKLTLCDYKAEVFKEFYASKEGSTNITSLVTLRNHPKEHFSKMITNILPIF